MQEAEAKRSQLFTDITLRIRRSLKLEDVLNTTVHEVRQALKADRVVIYRFNPDWTGTIIAESVAPNWMQTKGRTINDPFREDYIQIYAQGRVKATNNIYKAGFTTCHREILEGLQIKANLVAPIVNNNQLVSLLCAHQCSKPRYWQKTEIELVKQLAIQVGIALEQASLLREFQEAQKVLRLRDRAIAAASNAIIITDPRLPDNPIIFCNPAFETITGYLPEEAIGRNCRFLQGKDTDPATLHKLRSAIRDGHECQVVIKNYRKDGNFFWTELTISPVRDAFGQVINYIGVQSDITLRKQAEEELKRSQEALQSQLLKLLTDVKEASGNLAAGEISTSEIGVVADVFNTIIQNLRQIATQVKTTAYQVNVSLEENSSAIAQLADEALKHGEEISHALEEMDKMNLSIQIVADSARQAAEVANTTSNTAQAAGFAIDNTVSSILNLQRTITEKANKVKRLGESSQKISYVVSLIGQIALQTNLLAINAKIEAVGVGKEGRGLAIVAEQIAKLAEQSIEATKEIQEMLENIELETSEVVKAIQLGTIELVEGVNFVQDAKYNLEQILEVSCQIDNLVHSISTATACQTQTYHAIALQMKEIASASQSTADSSRMVSNSLQQTQQVAQQLQASVGIFNTGS